MNIQHVRVTFSVCKNKQISLKKFLRKLVMTVEKARKNQMFYSFSLATFYHVYFTETNTLYRVVGVQTVEFQNDLGPG